MTTHRNENIDELLQRLFGDGCVKESAEDIQKGEQILRDNPAPLPAAEVIFAIKSVGVKVIARNKARAFRSTIYKVAAIAAAVLIISAVSVRIFETGAVKTVKVATIDGTNQTVSQDDEFFSSDVEMETLAAEVEQVEQELATLQWDLASENSSYGDIIELELKLIEVDSDFWKG